MLEHLFGKKTAPKETPQHHKSESYDLEEGKAYILLGGQADQIKAKCDSCGAPFKGPCQPACEHCSTQRLAYYIDITNIKGLEKIPDKSKDQDISFFLPEGGSADFSDYAVVKRVVASQVKFGFNPSAGVIIAKNFKCGDYPAIGTLIIADGGTVQLGFNPRIDKLIVGKKVGPINTNEYARIEEFLTVSSDTKYKMGFRTKVGTQRMITHEEFVSLIIDASTRDL